jgi:hypothetical protein
VSTCFSSSERQRFSENSFAPVGNLNNQVCCTVWFSAFVAGLYIILVQATSLMLSIKFTSWCTCKKKFNSWWAVTKIVIF